MPAKTRDEAREARADATGREVVPFDAKAAAVAVRGLLESREGQLRALLLASGQAGEAQVERFLTVALDAVTRDNRILKADQLSVVAAVRMAAMYGLEPSPAIGDGAIVVYWNGKLKRDIAQFQPMFRGLAKLARRSPNVAGIDWQIVHRNDLFRIRLGTVQEVEHEPVLDGNPGDIVGAYAFARLMTGFVVPMWMTIAEINRIRDQASRDFRENGEASLWAKWPEAMQLKTVVRALMKKLDLDPLAALALAADDVSDRPAVPKVTVRPITDLRKRLGVPDRHALTPEEAEEAEPVVDPTCGDQAPEGGVAEGEVCTEAADHVADGTSHKSAAASWPI